MGVQQRLHFIAQLPVPGARAVQKRGALLKRELDGLGEESQLAICIIVHIIRQALAGRNVNQNPSDCSQSPPAVGGSPNCDRAGLNTVARIPNRKARTGHKKKDPLTSKFMAGGRSDMN